MLTFTREDTPTIQDGMVVRYHLQDRRFDGEISASRNGIVVCGHFPRLDRAGCLAFADQLERAGIHQCHLADPATRENLTEAQVDDLLTLAGDATEGKS
jgi:hypothetical protein